MNIIQELDNLKAYIAGLARTDMVLTSMPPQHNFSAGATVENVIREIEKIQSTWISEPMTKRSAAARTLRYFIDHGTLNANEYAYLLEIANMMDNEVNDLWETAHQDFKFSSDVSANCLALAEYISSYVENDGPHTKKFIEGLYQYLDKINSEIKELKEKSKDTLLIKLQKIINH